MSFKVLDEHRLAAADAATLRLLTHRTEAWAQLDDVEALRERAHSIRMQTIDDLEGSVQQFVAAVESAGGRTYRCSTAADASATVARICADADAKLVAKSKSMATEEIDLGAALEAAGIEVVETDLGEYIVQLAGERPSHMITPAIHKTAAQIRESSRTGKARRSSRSSRRSRWARRPTPPRLRACRHRHHRCELRGCRHRHARARHERGQRRTLHRRSRAFTSRVMPAWR